MALAIKPNWNPTTVTLAAVTALVSWPLALPVAAYAIWGERLAGPEGSLETAKETARDWFSRKAPNRAHHAAAYPAAQAYRTERFDELDAQRRAVDAEVEAFAAAEDAKRFKAEREAFERFVAERNA